MKEFLKSSKIQKLYTYMDKKDYELMILQLEENIIASLPEEI